MFQQSKVFSHLEASLTGEGCRQTNEKVEKGNHSMQSLAGHKLAWTSMFRQRFIPEPQEHFRSYW